MNKHDKSTRGINVNNRESRHSLSSIHCPVISPLEYGLHFPLISRCPFYVCQWFVSISNSFVIARLTQGLGYLCGDKRDKSQSGSISYPAIKLISELPESKLVSNLR